MSRGGWRYGHQEMRDESVPLITSVGWLLKSGRRALIIAHSYDHTEGGAANGVLKIPRGSVVEIHELKMVTPQNPI